MSKREPSGDERAERSILDLLDAQGRDRVLSSASEPDREYVELLGLLPRALDEVSPPAVVKQRILEAVGAASVDHEVSMIGERETASARRSPQPVRAIATWPRGFLPIAASIAAVMMVVTGWLVIQVQLQQSRITELSIELASARSITADLVASQGMLAEVRSRLSLVTAAGAEFCALNPPKGSSATAARGVAVMHALKDEWFLRIEGLEPCPQGRTYTVWFATDDGDVPGPIFAVKANEAVELMVTGRPEKINAIMITLEDEAVPREPSTAPLLYGDERMQLL